LHFYLFLSQLRGYLRVISTSQVFRRAHPVDHQAGVCELQSIVYDDKRKDALRMRPMALQNILMGFVLGAMASSGIEGLAGEKNSSTDEEPVKPLACRLSNYLEFEEEAYTHLPAIGIRHVFINVPPPIKLESVQKRLSNHGLIPVVMRGDADLSVEAGLGHLAEQLESCQNMGVKYLFLSVKRRDVEKQVIYDRLRQAGEIAKKHGVIIALETHPNLATNGDVQLETMRQVHHPNVRINFDTGNIHYYNRGTDAPTELKKIIDYVATVEVKDHNGEFESWYFPALGRGKVNFPAVLQILREHHYAGPVTMEIEGIKGIRRNRQEVEKDIAESAAYVQSLGKFK